MALAGNLCFERSLQRARPVPVRSRTPPALKRRSVFRGPRLWGHQGGVRWRVGAGAGPRAVRFDGVSGKESLKGPGWVGRWVGGWGGGWVACLLGDVEPPLSLPINKNSQKPNLLVAKIVQPPKVTKYMKSEL